MILLATTTTTATTITTMNSAAYCNAYQLDDAINGDTCDYVAVAVAIAKNGGFSKTREKTEIICNMLRVGFKLEDIFKAEYDAFDCEDASCDTGRGGGGCYDVKDTFEDDACVSAAQNPWASTILFSFPSSTHTTTTTTMTTFTATTTTTTISTTTTTVLGVNSRCDPRNDSCDTKKELFCHTDFYECRYITTTVPSKSALTTVFHSIKPIGKVSATTTTKSSDVTTSSTSIPNTLANISLTSKIGEIVGGVVGGLVVLIIGTALFCFCRTSKTTDEVAVRARNVKPVELGVRKPYDQETSTYNNPTFEESQYASIDDVVVSAPTDFYEEPDRKRPELYAKGFLAGSAAHALRDARRQSQLSTDDDDIEI